MKKSQFEQLVLQALEHELGGTHVYTTALKCVVEDDLKEEWEKYLEQTRSHVESLKSICETLGLDPDQRTPARDIVRGLGAALVASMNAALATGDSAAAELVACEAVVIAETKDHLNWELLSRCAEELRGEAADALQGACERIEDEEDEHLYHTQGWCRELWIKSLGLSAVLPPPEEEKDVKTAIGAARAQQAADRERKHTH
jgi:rubrerythrin